MNARYTRKSGSFTLIPDDEEDKALIAVLDARWDKEWFNCFHIDVDAESVVMTLFHCDEIRPE